MVELFSAKYKRVGGNALPNNVTIKRTYKKRGRRKGQRCRAFENLLRKGLTFAKNIAGSKIGKILSKSSQ